MKKRNLVLGQLNTGKTSCFCLPEIIRTRARNIFYIGKDFSDKQLTILKNAKIEVVFTSVEELQITKSKFKRVYVINSSTPVDFELVNLKYINDRRSLLIINDINKLENVSEASLLLIKKLLITCQTFTDLDGIINYNSVKFINSFNSLSFFTPLINANDIEKISDITGVYEEDLLDVDCKMYMRYYTSHFFKIKYIKKEFIY